MNRLIFILLPLLFLVGLVAAQSVKLTWDASPSSGVAGYRIYYGTNSRAYSCELNAGCVQTQCVTLPRRGRWFFAVTAYDTNAVESELSNEVQYQERPRPPVLDGGNVVRLCPVIERSTNLVDWSAVLGEPTFFPATNAAEFFRVSRLTIENLKRVE